MMFRKAKIIISSSVLGFGLFILILSFFVSSPYQVDQIKRVDGVFEEYFTTYRKYSGTGHIILNDGQEYIVPSIVSSSFNEDGFLKDIHTGDTISLIVGIDSVGSVVLAINANDVEYLNYNNAQQNHSTNQIIGFVLGAVFIVAGFIALLVAIISRPFIW